MQIKHLFCLLIFQIISYSCFAKADLTIELDEGLPEAELIAITSDPATQSAPDISLDYVVWNDKRNGNWDIYAADLATRTEIQVTDNSFDQTRPAVSGKIIVWSDYRYGGTSIFGFDIDTRAEFEIARNVINSPIKIGASVAISGDIVSWQSYDENYFIQLYIISTSEIINLPHGDGNNSQARISGQKIVWQRTNSSNDGVFVYDVLNKNIEQLTDIGHSPWYPDISSNTVVWLSLPIFGEPKIIYCDLPTGSKKEINSPLLVTQPPRISGNWIVWTEKTESGNDIALWDMDTELRTAVTDNIFEQNSPAIAGRNIVWQDGRNGNEDIYLYSFHSEITLDTLIDRIKYYVAQKEIRRGNGEAMLAKLHQTGSAITRGKLKVASNLLEAFINMLNGLAKNQIDPIVVDDLSNLAYSVKNTVIGYGKVVTKQH